MNIKVKNNFVFNDKALCLRPIEPQDTAMMHRCFDRLTPDVIRKRFLHSMKVLSKEIAVRFCTMDKEIEEAFVLIDENVAPHEMRAVGRFYWDIHTNTAEFSVLVEQNWSKLGLGACLMKTLVDECRARKIYEIWGVVLMDNTPMLRLCKKLGFVRKGNPDEFGTVLISLRL